MHKYRIEATKNGVTQSIVINSDLDFNDMHQKLWHSFNNSQLISSHALMIGEPDSASIYKIDNEDRTHRQGNAS